MIFECGPISDRRTLEIVLPDSKRLGVFVSGGMDSALLYYLFCKLNHDAGNTHEIVPFTMIRTEGSKFFARPIINYINSCFNLPKQDLIIVGDNKLPEDQQIISGIMEVLVTEQAEIIYVGVIEALPEHMIGWHPIPAPESYNFKTPFVNLNKSHIVDLIYQLNVEKLFTMSHSCIDDIGRCNTCNGCKERAWGFELMNKIDTSEY